MKNIFTKHPNSVGESYFQHMRIALWCGLRMILGGVACIIHAIFPFLFMYTASATVRKLMKQFDARTQKVNA